MREKTVKTSAALVAGRDLALGIETVQKP